jgi:uncharacterized Zn finger protein (UPF0148 family)
VTSSPWTKCPDCGYVVFLMRDGRIDCAICRARDPAAAGRPGDEERAARPSTPCGDKSGMSPRASVAASAVPVAPQNA